MANYLTFASSEAFTIGVNNATKNWDGTLYYSTDAVCWNEWDGTTAIASAEHDGEQKIYMRGVGNSVITGGGYQCFEQRWVSTGNNIRCIGNIENLLDYATVANGEHPVMGGWCYCYLFAYWRNLITAPELPAVALVGRCYSEMFYTCTSLTTVPSLPAVVLQDYCYNNMFNGCTSLKFSKTQSEEYPNEYRIPTSGEGEYGTALAVTGLDNTFGETGGTFTGSPDINTTYYTANEVIYPNVTVHPTDPKSLTAGWRVGQLIAAMRNA